MSFVVNKTNTLVLLFDTPYVRIKPFGYTSLSAEQLAHPETVDLLGRGILKLSHIEPENKGLDLNANLLQETPLGVEKGTTNLADLLPKKEPESEPEPASMPEVKTRAKKSAATTEQ
jgi:hypothetical protein